MNKDNGFIYIVFGNSFNREANYSIQSLLNKNKNSKVALFTDDINSFNNIESEKLIKYLIKPEHIRAKVDFISESPFQNSIYLDSDTFILQNIEDVFDCFSRDDVLVTRCFERERENYNHIKEYKAIPYGFSEVNGGFLGFKKNAVTDEFFKLWKKYFYKYKKNTSGWDQVSLRIALWQSKVRLNFLPYEYNTRSIENRIKLLNNKKILGENHLEPKVFHMHYNSEVHNNEFKINNIEELEKILRNKAYLI